MTVTARAACRCNIPDQFCLLLPVQQALWLVNPSKHDRWLADDDKTRILIGWKEELVVPVKPRVWSLPFQAHPYRVEISRRRPVPCGDVTGNEIFLRGLRCSMHCTATVVKEGLERKCNPCLFQCNDCTAPTGDEEYHQHFSVHTVLLLMVAG